MGKTKDKETEMQEIELEPIDISFYVERVCYYRDQQPDPVTGRYKGFGEIFFDMDAKGQRWIYEYWKDSLEWFKKMEFDRQVNKKYCQCEGTCKECGKKQVPAGKYKFVVRYIEPEMK